MASLTSVTGVYSPGPGDDQGSLQSVSINDSRRIFNFGERVAELAPEQSPFFAYLSKVAKKPTDDPVFKFLEKRHQWQRRNFEVKTVHTTGTFTSAAYVIAANGLALDCGYDVYGREEAGQDCPFLLAGQVIAIDGVYSVNGSAFSVDGSNGFDVTAYYRINADPTAAGSNSSNTGNTTIGATFLKAMYKPTGSNGANATASGQVAPADASKLRLLADAVGQVVGSSHVEAGTDPEGWRDEFYNREGYCQIFKTAVPLFSGTSLATRYRGDSNEYMRVYKEKLMEHKMDLEHALLFGIGGADEAASGPARRTWGILPYTEIHGKVKMVDKSEATYDTFIDMMEDIFSPESGNSGDKLVLASREVMTWLNKLGGSGFLANTMANVGAGSASAGSGMDIANVPGQFGHNVTKVSTLYGNLHFIHEPLFRGPWKDYAVLIDLKNLAYRPLVGNGVSRDTQIITNVQNNNVDGRKDMILTEAGLEISLPETHTVLKFKA
tara:strand:- start:2892 stop:4376 length:1485 start_codon:yes stop_codon:yes gene_type:complete